MSILEDRPETIRVLLVEDDEDDYTLVRIMLSKISRPSFTLDWVQTGKTALEELKKGFHDVYILDYQLGGPDGLSLLKSFIRQGCRAPIILMTGHGSYELDVQAAEAGASDFLSKDQLNAPLLERTIRYAIVHKKTEDALRRSRRQLKYFSSRLITVQEEERRRISIELHDSIGSSLSAIKYVIENIAREAKRKELPPDAFDSVISMIQGTIEDSRRIMADLRPSILDDLGVITAIGWLSREFMEKHEKIRVERSVDVTEAEIPPMLKIVIFRIVQEAFQNIAKYSEADRVDLCFKRTGSKMILSVEDNGKGFEVIEVMSAPAEKGNGLNRGGMGIGTIRERTELSGGEFEIDSAPGKGTRIRAVWPDPLFDETA